MQRVLLLGCLVLWVSTGVTIFPAHLGAQSPATVQTGEVILSTVSEWESGTLDNLIISNNDDGELRLGNSETDGVFVSELRNTSFAFNALGVVWQAQVPSGTRLTLEARGGGAPDQLGDWRSFVAGDARSQTDDGALAIESVLTFPPETNYVQMRAIFQSTVDNASPVLSVIQLHYLNAPASTTELAGLPRVPASYGPSTLTPSPRIIQRVDWNGDRATEQIGRHVPRGVILHQIGDGTIGEDPRAFLRALVAYHREVLGWNDTAFHFIIDDAGNIFEGHLGGPTAAVPRLADGDSAIHIAVIGSGLPSEVARDSLVGLLAWLGDAYDIAPDENHVVVSSDGTSDRRPNIAAHSEVVPAATDPSLAFRARVGEWRRQADQTIVRSRWYFAEGNVQDYVERLSVLNTSANESSVRFRLLRDPGEEVIRTVTVDAGDRFDLVVNNIFSDTTSVPAIIEASETVIAERFMDFGTDVSLSPGITQPARVWYFAEGTTDGDARTFLVLFNPQSNTVNVTITYIQNDGTLSEQEVRIPGLQRTVVTVADGLPDAGFGMRVIATQPIVAERTMLFGPGNAPDSGGFHTSPGILTLSRDWFFAEGTTQNPFNMSVLVLNPNEQSSNVSVTFQTPDGTSLTRRYAIPPTTRLAIDVNEVVPDLGVATTVEADRPVAVERALYWRDGQVGTVSSGAIVPAFTWRFADGRTSNDFQQFLLFNNPNENQARVTVEFVLADGTQETRRVVMPGESRYTMAVHELYPDQQAIAATVRATQPIVAERSLYPGDPATDSNRGGATAFGVPEMNE
ncbi:MAG: N-acetylmuramoyl-L-alanine amidase [Chloroflexi bacterium AL-W]|nr:N-acetylmuramoyl-L-alanine amidase [Chloroflexi bacterium AL-N1]NOK69092.1 N-acetylmuramoyl-L-alanine amidase [Chloroflexi bacterium AL-N10]NOK77075.1 N-acetylmuramoyl-L-alanine amidase [Chloroflexi bacterium AL-N5]NOK83720.1 N-acetylmuramoyl-L-alanine amidase [Chloroflexi bacterium AL-W]NOK90930.1 N-acetylmuramoyl-L-alanine amidase [Chloroflexi bacterium AL-N15]